VQEQGVRRFSGHAMRRFSVHAVHRFSGRTGNPSRANQTRHGGGAWLWKTMENVSCPDALRKRLALMRGAGRRRWRSDDSGGWRSSFKLARESHCNPETLFTSLQSALECRFNSHHFVHTNWCLSHHDDRRRFIDIRLPHDGIRASPRRSTNPCEPLHCSPLQHPE
jgi:hypothetical protein